MLLLKLTVFTIFLNAHAFKSGSILNDMDPYAGILIKYKIFCIKYVITAEIEKLLVQIKR